MKYGLKFNPFTVKNVIDMSDFKRFPFLITSTQEVLKYAIELDLKTKKMDEAMRFIIIGERGIGKTSTLMFLKDIVDNNADMSIYSRYVNNMNLLGSAKTFERLIIPDESVLGNNSKDRISNWLSDKLVYLFIDVPDMFERNAAYSLAFAMQFAMEFKNIRIFITMNKSHMIKLSDITEVVGKYTVVHLTKFDMRRAKELISSRLKSVREIDVPDDLYPFTEEAVKKIYNYSHGIPRNIITICDLCITYGGMNNSELITENIVEEVVAKYYISTIPHIESESKKNKLMKLYEIIKNEFNGYVYGESNLYRVVKKKLGWSMITTRKYLREMEKLGMVVIKKSPENTWTNIIEAV
ncbi:MAG TPA: hypothetical protein ENJ25_03135 [Firmicutes bacterium]|nr:hypothetical protein [Bacillota bacterium]